MSSLITTPTVNILPAKAVLKQYATYLESESYCIDVSLWPIKVLHANSNRNQVIENLELEFPTWSRNTGIRVAPNEYHDFRKNLKTRLMEILPRISGQSFRPVKARFITSRGALVANSYVPFNPPVPACLATPPILQDFLNRLFPDVGEQKIVLQFFAHLIQRPEQRTQFGLILSGAGSMGKSLLVRMVEAALGDMHWWHENDYKPVLEKFSEVLPNNLLCTFDDAVAGRDTYDLLKQEVTRAYQDVQIKGDQKTVLREVYSRIVVISNDARPLRLIDDRRFYVPAPCAYLEDIEEAKVFGYKFYKEFFDRPETPAWLFHWFMSIDISDFNHAIMIPTETHRQMSDASISSLEKYTASYVEDSPIFHEKQIMEYLNREGLSRVRPDDLKLKLLALNYIHRRQAVAGVEGMVWLWKPDVKRSRALTDGETAAILLARSADF